MSLTILVLAHVAISLCNYRLLRSYLVYKRVFNKLYLADARFVPQYIWMLTMASSVAWFSVIGFIALT